MLLSNFCTQTTQTNVWNAPQSLHFMPVWFNYSCICQLDCDRKIYYELYKYYLNASCNSYVVNKPADAQGVWAYARSDYGSGDSGWLLPWMTGK